MPPAIFPKMVAGKNLGRLDPRGLKAGNGRWLCPPHAGLTSIRRLPHLPHTMRGSNDFTARCPRLIVHVDLRPVCTVQAANSQRPHAILSHVGEVHGRAGVACRLVWLRRHALSTDHMTTLFNAIGARDCWGVLCRMGALVMSQDGYGQAGMKEAQVRDPLTIAALLGGLILPLVVTITLIYIIL